MNRNKICPDCEVEYLPHIEKCADCGAVLLLYEEHTKMREERKQLAAKAIENAVVVRKGDLKWLGELSDVLIDAGIPNTVTSEAGCNKGHCRDKFLLIVDRGDLARAQERIEDYFRELHPDLRASHELAKQGKCPACGSPVGASDAECSDCGLMLVVIEEEDRGDESCGEQRG
jgi:hypothetical protein